MVYPYQIRGVMTNRLALYMVAVISFHPDSTKGNSVVFLDEPSGEFQSPGYPDLDDGMHCTWIITAPLNHRVTITFLNFDLVERHICKDEVEIYDGDVKRDTYRGTTLHQKSITSISNTISVVLRSCLTSLLSDRRGICVSYSTDQTVKKVTSTQLSIVTAMSIESTSKPTRQKNPNSSDVFASAPTIVSSTEYTEVTSSANSTGQELLHPLIGALSTALVVTIIVVMLIFKRRKAKCPSNDTTTRCGNVETNQAEGYFTTVISGVETNQAEGYFTTVISGVEANQAQGYFTTVFSARTSVISLGHDYSEVKEKQ